MYYLDFTQLYTYTNKEQRVAVRRALTPAQRDKVMASRIKQQHGQCFWCGTDINMADHLDHIVPIYRGGDNRLRNLVAACRSCNMTKSTDQIEILNPYTIADYLKLQQAVKAYKEKCQLKGVRSLRYIPRRVQLYKVYRADLFKSV